MVMAYRKGGAQLLMLGTLYDSCTYMHVVEAFLWAEMLRAAAETHEVPGWQQDKTSAQELRKLVAFPSINRPALGGFWEGYAASRPGMMSKGLVGDAECRLCSITDFVDVLIEEMVNNPQPYLNGHEHELTANWVESVRRLGAVARRWQQSTAAL